MILMVKIAMIAAMAQIEPPSIEDAPPVGYVYQWERDDDGEWQYAGTIPEDEVQEAVLEDGCEWCDSCGNQWTADELEVKTYGRSAEWHGVICPDCVEFWLEEGICE